MPRGESRLTRISEDRRQRVLALVGTKPMFVHELASVLKISKDSVYAYLNKFHAEGLAKYTMAPYGRGFKRKWSRS